MDNDRRVRTAKGVKNLKSYDGHPEFHKMYEGKVKTMNTMNHIREVLSHLTCWAGETKQKSRTMPFKTYLRYLWKAFMEGSWVDRGLHVLMLAYMLWTPSILVVLDPVTAFDAGALMVLVFLTGSEARYLHASANYLWYAEEVILPKAQEKIDELDEAEG